MNKKLYLFIFLLISICWRDAHSATCTVYNSGGGDCGSNTCLFDAVLDNTCETIKIEVNGTITMKSGFSLSGKRHIIGKVDAGGKPLTTIKAGPDVSTQYLIKLSGTYTGAVPTLENIAVEFPGKTAISVSGNDFWLKNVVARNSNKGLLVSGNNNAIESSMFYSNAVGIEVNTGDGNLITKSVFCSSSGACNSTNAIELVESGNDNLAYAHDLKAVVDKDNNFVGIMGKGAYATDLYEVYISNSSNADLQGQGKTYKKDIVPAIIGGGWGDPTGNFFAPVSGLSPDASYTLLSIHSDADDTSEFSRNGDFSLDKNRQKGGPKCFEQIWFTLNAFGNGYDWNADYDNDSCSNKDEVPDMACDSASWKSNPSDVNSNTCGGKTPAPATSCNDIQQCTPAAAAINPAGCVVAAISKAICTCHIEHPDFSDIKCLDSPDYDGIPSYDDNCPLIYNPDQADADGDGFGNVCEGDADGDGVLDPVDNCLYDINPDQVNADSDPFGNACDPDADNDGLTNSEETTAGTSATNPDSDNDGYCDGPSWGESYYTKPTCIPMDNCPNKYNSNQKDTDDDGIGDACDMAASDECAEVDSDGDNVKDYLDNCPWIYNPGQLEDASDNPCDPDDNDNSIEDFREDWAQATGNDSDLDKILTGDTCQSVWNPWQMKQDSDGDKTPDACDADSDGDGFSNIEEWNNYQVKTWVKEKVMQNIEGLCGGDQCLAENNPIAPDADGDGIVDSCDLCKDMAGEEEQFDLDSDGIGDACDDDRDGDGILNANDNCPDIVNPIQEDSDSDGVGNACDIDFAVSAGTSNAAQTSLDLNLQGGGTGLNNNEGCSSNLSSAGVDFGVAPFRVRQLSSIALILFPLAAFFACRRMKNML